VTISRACIIHVYIYIHVYNVYMHTCVYVYRVACDCRPVAVSL